MPYLWSPPNLDGLVSILIDLRPDGEIRIPVYYTFPLAGALGKLIL